MPQVPLMWTVYLQLAFRNFVLLGPRDEARQPGFFEVGQQGWAWGAWGHEDRSLEAWAGRHGS